MLAHSLREPIAPAPEAHSSFLFRAIDAARWVHRQNLSGATTALARAFAPSDLGGDFLLDALLRFCLSLDRGGSRRRLGKLERHSQLGFQNGGRVFGLFRFCLRLDAARCRLRERSCQGMIKLNLFFHQKARRSALWTFAPHRQYRQLARLSHRPQMDTPRPHSVQRSRSSSLLLRRWGIIRGQAEVAHR